MKIKLANPGPQLSRIIAGVMNWGVWGAKLSTYEMAELIGSCCEMGVTSFDHADIYGGYTTEAEFGKALGETGISRDKIQLISKCGICYPSSARPEFSIKYYDTSKKYIIKAVEQSLVNLKTEYLDLLLIHRPSPVMNYQEMTEAFAKLKEQGKILYAGVSNFTGKQIDVFRQFHPVSTNQVEASLLHLDPFLDGTFDTCQKYAIKPMAWSPLGGGKLFESKKEYEFVIKRSRLLEVAQSLDMEVSTMAYAFLMSHPVGILPVTGSSKTSRILTAVKAMDISLTRQQWFEIWTASTGVRVP